MKNKILYTTLFILLFSCVTTEEVIILPEENIETKNDVIVVEEITPPIIQETTDDKIINMLNHMTIEEKIGQLFIFQIRGYTKLDRDLKDFLIKYKPGGVIFFSNNIINNIQVKTFTTDLQEISNIPMFIAVDEEGGLVSRLGKEKNVDVTHLPPALTVGNHNNPILAYNSGKILGRELFSLGFNMDMAPVADVNTNPENPVIGNRTYSANQHIAGEMAINMMKGLQEESVISVFKHFPGHGDTKTDSHLGAVISPHNRERLNQVEFVPFIRGISEGLDVIMIAHMNMPGISSTPLPSTLNPVIITDILRGDLGFNGVIMTDALDMGAITNNFSTKEASILGIKAGIDILLIPDNQPLAFNALLEGFKSGEIDEERINQSVLRILNLKEKTGVIDRIFSKEDILDVKNDPIHQQLIKTIPYK